MTSVYHATATRRLALPSAYQKRPAEKSDDQGLPGRRFWYPLVVSVDNNPIHRLCAGIIPQAVFEEQALASPMVFCRPARNGDFVNICNHLQDRSIQ